MSTDVPDTERPKRADALRNRDRVLEAARTAFAEGGPDVAVSEILKLAGVGSGTLFRHFPTKHDLLIAVLESTFDRMSDTMEVAVGFDDPWDGIVHVLTTTAEIQAGDRMFLESVGPELFGEERFLRRNVAMMEQLERLVERAHEAGVIRADLTAEDLPFILSAIGGATQQCAPSVTGRGHCVPGADGLSSNLWRRYLGMVLDGLRPEGAQPLAEGPPTREQLIAAKSAKHAAAVAPAAT